MESKKNSILEGLNSEQRKAVECISGPVLIVAGAGSGKTRVLTNRIANILTSGVESSKVMALTFTKKAATEMKERIARLIGEQAARRLVMGTFHSVFVRFLREYCDALGYPSNFTIYDSSDQQSAVKGCIRELGLDDKLYKPKEVLSRISMAKNNLVTVGGYRSSRELLDGDLRSRRPRLIDVYELYQHKLKAAGVMDFDDILVNMNILLRDVPQALEVLQNRFSHILVDEYQDTNRAQYVIIKKLSQIHRNICVVGDDSQSIYAFRGAKIENILNFKKDYPECRLFRLEQNYRSTRNIVEAANSLISKNEGRIPKECWSDGERGERIRILQSFTEAEEAAMIVSEISGRIRTAGAMYQDFAILYRTNSQSRALEEALRRRNIPYVIYSGNSFFERAEIKDMMAYLKLVVNPNDDEAFKRAVNKPARGIGETTKDAVLQIANSIGTSLFKAGFQVPKVQAFCRMIDSLAQLRGTLDAYALAQKVYEESGLYAFYKSDNSIEGLARVANLDELLNSVSVFVEEQQSREDEVLDSLEDFLENVSLLSNVDLNEDEDSSNNVSLMTVHSAKGLEFPYVFVAGMEENLFPNVGNLNGMRELEEERRLFYVAITRAMKAVYLSLASTRMRNGKHESNPPSRFIREIDGRFIENPSFGTASKWQSKPATQPVKPVQPSKPDVLYTDFVPVDMSQLFEGERVEHNRFGPGRIISIDGVAPELKARIAFDRYGEKLLLLKYAKLRPEKH